MRVFLTGLFLSVLSLSACAQHSMKGFSTAASGLQYKFHRQNETGNKPQVSDILNVSMRYFINDSLLFDSKMLGREMEFPLMPVVFPGDFYEGLAMMSKGDSASFVCNADSIFLKVFRVPQLPDFVKPNSNMRFDIGMIDFLSQEAFEAKQIAKQQVAIEESNRRLLEYVSKNEITVQPQPSGLYYIEVTKGNGPKPQPGQKVRVHYRGTLLDGTKFDASYDRNQPFEFVLGMGQVIKGWDEGIGLLHVGGKGILLLPQHLAYGERAAGTIPPFSPLIFEVELLEILN